MRRIICWIIGHKKVHFFAYPAISGYCERCGKDYYKPGAGVKDAS